jgi:hypothetical protein
MKRLGSVLTLLIVLATLIAPRPVARAKVIQDSRWLFSDNVGKFAFDRNTMYLSRAFTSISPATGAFVALDTTAGDRDRTFPRVYNEITA